ncbi:MAG: DUF262 domain-containing protein [Bacillota bacterium]|nr:DUF262 domain-containing protein [Bacillota bacterium]
MEANKIRLLEFLGSGKRTFNIPVYQRNYDWQSEHCRRLFKDIEKIALSDFQIEHFLGTVVYVISYVQPTFMELVLIDGQQRITSITLLLKALYDAIQDEELKEDIYESYIINKRAPEALRIKLKPIESDMSAYQNILSNENINTNTNIYNNYMLFKSLVSESSVSPDQLYNALNNIELVYIQLEKDKKSENPQLIFESLNSTGLSLTQADLIRNFLLMNHTYDEQAKLYKEYWMKVEKLLSNNKISDFVRDYLTMKTSTISTKDKVYENFKEFATNPKSNFDEQGLLEDLLVFAKYYSYFLYFNSSNVKINYCLEQFQQLKSTTIYPVLLYIFDDCFAYKKISDDELIEILNVFISYIFRRQICGYPTNALNKIFANLISEIEESKETLYLDKVLSILSKKSSSGTFPRNKEFEIEFIQKDLYKSKIDKYALCQLENYLSKEKIYFSNDITTEHIMPQTLTPQWQIELGKKFEEIHAQYLHTIGNLTISGYNSELSNKSFIDKKEIFKTSNISICRNICEYNNWNDTSIRDRAKKMFEIALKIWSIPEKYNSEKEKVGIIDYTSLYSILTDINITGEKPKQLIIMDMEYSVSSWKDLMRVLCRELFELDSAIFYNLVRHKDFTGRERYIINGTSDNMNSPYKISDDIFVETNLSAIDILNYCKIICNHYQTGDDVYFMLNKNK